MSSVIQSTRTAGADEPGEKRVDTSEDDSLWGRDVNQLRAFSRNISVDYLVLFLQMVIGLVMLPFNVSHLGQSTYGLWVLAASITTYFSLFDLGYAVAQVKFVAECRARRDREGLNQILCTMFGLFSVIGFAVFGVALLIAFHLESLFNVNPEQAATGRFVLLMVSAYVALGFPFSVFGAVVNGFQRHYRNGGVAIVTTIVVAVVNVIVLATGHGLIELVASTTVVRVLSYVFYRANAYRAFPGLEISIRNFSMARLKQVTGFSFYLLLIDVANKLNYSSDAVVIGAFLNTAAVSVWAVAQRLIETTQTLTGQVNGALFPVVVDIATLGEAERLRRLLIQGTRISLAMVVPMAVGLAMLAEPLVTSWVGPQFAGSVPIIYILAVAVTARVGSSMATTLLKGAGRHKLLAAADLGAAAVNIALSIVLVRYFGLEGVAVATLIPLAAVSIFLIFPAACRRVRLPIGQAVSQAVWPTIWPVVPMAMLLAVTRGIVGRSLSLVALQSLAAGIVYSVVFVKFALGREEREWYGSRIRQLIKRPRAVTA